MKRRTFLAALSAANMTAAMPRLAFAADKQLSVLLPPWGTLPKAMSERFTKETGIALQIQTMGWDDIRTKVVTSMIANTAPADGVELDWSWVGQFGAAGWFDSLNDIVPQETVDDIPTAKIFEYDNNLLALPYNNDFRVLIYNKAHLDQAGITEPPKTPAELLDAARAIKTAGISEHPIGLPLSASEGTSTAWYLLTMAFGGDLFDENFNPLFTGKESGGYQAMAFVLAALKEGLIDPAATGMLDTQVQQVFQAGETSFDVAGWVGNLAVYSDPAKSKIADQVAAAMVPSSVGKSRTFGLPEAVGIPSIANNKEAAATFINWIAKPENEIEIYNSLGNLPPRLSVLESLNKEGKLFAGDVLIAQSKTTVPLFRQGTPGWYPQFSSGVSSTINAAAKGQYNAEQAVAEIASQVEKAKRR